jgi:hypothetical protein
VGAGKRLEGHPEHIIYMHLPNSDINFTQNVGVPLCGNRRIETSSKPRKHQP